MNEKAQQGALFLDGNYRGDFTVRGEGNEVVAQVTLEAIEWLDLLRCGQVKRVPVTLDGVRGYGTEHVGTVNLSTPYTSSQDEWQFTIMLHGVSGCEIDVWVRNSEFASCVVGADRSAPVRIRDRRW